MVARPDPGTIGTAVDRAAFDEACERLAGAGYALVSRDRAWQAFDSVRAEYVGSLEAMGAYWATPANSWLGSGATLRSAVHDPSDVPTP